MKKILLMFSMLMMASVNVDAQIKMRIEMNDGSLDEYPVSSVKSVSWIEENKKTIPAGLEAVDLGLPSGLKWANMNIGAETPEDYGDYFAWGETEPKDYYDGDTYRWCNGSYASLTKYCKDSYYGIVDDKTSLDTVDDVANANWGGSWRMPTMEELHELQSIRCTWNWTNLNGINGYKVTGPNGNFIFLPAAGYRSKNDSVNANSYGYYWSSELDSTTGGFSASGFGFHSSFWLMRLCYGRYLGLSVRAVCL